MNKLQFLPENALLTIRCEYSYLFRKNQIPEYQFINPFIMDTCKLHVIWYIGNLTSEGYFEPLKDNKEKEKVKDIEINEKEFELLKMLYARDVDIGTATDILNVSEKQLNYMVQKLLTLEMLHYSSFDEVALTDTGIDHLKQKKKDITKKVQWGKIIILYI